MESTAIVAAGASLTHQCLWSMSDQSRFNICPTCGKYSSLKAKKCFSCKSENTAPLQEVTIPYAFKLLQQELYQCGIHLMDKNAMTTGSKHILAASS